MNAKKSCFNKKIFTQNLWQALPFMLIMTAFLVALGLQTINAVLDMFKNIDSGDLTGNMFNTMKDQLRVLYSDDYLQILYACYSFFCGIFVFRYLYKKKLCTTIHALPLSRNCLFFTNTVSGLVMLIFPFLVTTILFSIYLVIYGYTFGYLFMTFIILVGYCMIFFALAIFTAMITGHLLAAPVIYFFLNFGAVICSFIMSVFVSTFYFGVSNNNGINTIFSPFTYLIRHFMLLEGYSSWIDTSTGYQAIIIYSIVAVILLIISFFMYQRRNMEMHGEPIVTKKLQPIFLYFGTFLGATIFTIIIFGIFNLATNSLYFLNATTFVMVIVFFLIGSILCYYILNMLLCKTLNVFGKSIKGILIYSVFAMVVLIFVKLDILGIESYQPKESEIVSIDMDIINYNAVIKDKASIKEVLNLHKDILSKKDSIIEAFDTHTEYDILTITYHLKGDESITRDYYIPCSDSGECTVGELKNIYSTAIEILNNPLHTLSRLEETLTYLDDLYVSKINNISEKEYNVTDYIFSDNSDTQFFDMNQYQSLVQALKKDISDGNLLSALYESDTQNVKYHVIISGENSSGNSSHYMEFPITDDAVHTLAEIEKLIDKGILTPIE